MSSLAGIGVSRDSRVQEKVGDEPGDVEWSSAEVAWTADKMYFMIRKKKNLSVRSRLDHSSS